MLDGRTPITWEDVLALAARAEQGEFSGSVRCLHVGRGSVDNKEVFALLFLTGSKLLVQRGLGTRSVYFCCAPCRDRTLRIVPVVIAQNPEIDVEQLRRAAETEGLACECGAPLRRDGDHDGRLYCSECDRP